MRIDGIPVVEEVVAEEAPVAGPALRVEDPELRAPPRRSGPFLLHHHLRPLAHDLTTEADPRAAAEAQAQPRCLRERADGPRREARRLEEDEERARPACDRGEAEEALREPVPGRRRAIREVHEEDVHGP
jgi:hypothetical protein